jgi:hypothetical protein
MPGSFTLSTIARTSPRARLVSNGGSGVWRKSPDALRPAFRDAGSICGRHKAVLTCQDHTHVLKWSLNART